MPPGMTEANPLERRADSHASAQRRRPKHPAPADDRSSDEDPEESGSDKYNTASETSTFGDNESGFSDDGQEPSSPSNAIKAQMISSV